MPGAAFYQGLNAAPDFKQRRLDSMQNITIATRMRDDSIAEMQERMKAMGLISTQLNKEAELQAEMLPADAERFKSAHEKLMTGVVDELGKYNNDPNMLRMMAPQVADKYSRDLISSPELRSAKENRKNFDLGTAAIQKGDLVDDVEIEYPGGTKETVPWIEAVDLHQQGAIKKLPFKSSMPVGELNPMAFLGIEMPPAEAKYGGKVSINLIADNLQAKYPRYSREQALQQAKLYADPETPGATHFLWGRVIPRYQGGGGSSLADMKYMDKILGVKSVTDNLHRAMFDPAMKTDYDPKTGAYNLNVTPIDLSKLKSGTNKGAGAGYSLQVKNNATDPMKSRFVVNYDDGKSEELSFDDLAQRILGASNVNIGDYSALMQKINGGMASNYNPMNYSAISPEIPFAGTIGGAGDAPPEAIANDPAMVAIWKNKYQRKQVSYGAPSSSGAGTELEYIPGISPPK